MDCEDSIERVLDPLEEILQPVMLGGKRLSATPGTEALRARATRELAALPAGLRGLGQAVEPYRVDISQALRELAAQLDQRYAPQSVSD